MVSALLLGKAAVANAKLAYQRSRYIYADERWQRLAAAGARAQRLLWASTSTKNPNYRDVMYVEELIGSGTVNTIWGNSDTPSENQYSSGSYEVGVKFKSTVAGTVTGARFYKQTWMDGYTHVGHLWSSTGQLLATATFTGESASGWQTVSLPSPVHVTANTTYVASYHSSAGTYSATGGYFSASGAGGWPISALKDGADGGNGVFLYGPAGFPNNTYNSGNYWVDAVFTP